MNPRKLSNIEIFTLPDKWKIGNSIGWENPNVDQKKCKPYDYLSFFYRVWEVDQGRYKTSQRIGNLCQKHNNRFYVA